MPLPHRKGVFRIEGEFSKSHTSGYTLASFLPPMKHVSPKETMLTNLSTDQKTELKMETMEPAFPRRSQNRITSATQGISTHENR